MKPNQLKSTEALFKSYGRGMYNICYRMIGNKQDAEDVLQDAFYKAYTKIGSLRSKDSFGAWIRQIVVNECLLFLRSRVYFTELEAAEKQPDDDDYHWMKMISMQRINDEIRKLPDGCRIVFNLFLLENYSHREIATMLEISESTSKSQYQRARQLLRNQLKKEM